MYPYVGTREVPRNLPSGLDVAAADGSQVAYDLLAAQGVRPSPTTTASLPRCAQPWPG